MRDQELRLECLKLAVGIAHRDANNDPKQMIALSKELCDYVLDGSAPDKKSSGNTAKKSG